MVVIDMMNLMIFLFYCFFMYLVLKNHGETKVSQLEKIIEILAENREKQEDYLRSLVEKEIKLIREEINKELEQQQKE